MSNSNCNVPLKLEFYAKQKSGQSKPIPEAQEKTLSHPTNWPTLEVKSTCLSAPIEKIEAINSDLKGPQAKWKRVIRSPELGNQEVIISKLLLVENKLKQKTFDQQNGKHWMLMMSTLSLQRWWLLIGPAESNELHKLEPRELGQTRAILKLTELVKKHSQQLFFSWKPELRMIF